MEVAKEIFHTVFKMCSTELIDIFNKIGYYSKGLITVQETIEVNKTVEKKVDQVIKQIFANNKET